MTWPPAASTNLPMVLASGPAREAPSPKSKAALDFALAALRVGDIAGAELRLRDILLADPFNADALAKLAEIAVEQGRIEDATVLLRKAVTADPQPERRLELIAHLQRFEPWPGIGAEREQPGGVAKHELDLENDLRRHVNSCAVEPRRPADPQ